MSELRRHRVIRCADCHAIVPHARTACSACGSGHRVGSLASDGEVDRTRHLHGVARKEIVRPLGAPVRPPSGPRPFWSRMVAAVRLGTPEIIGLLRRL